MIPDLAYISKSLYTINHTRSRPISLLGLEAIGLHTRSLCYLVNTLTFTKSIIRTVSLTKLIYTQEKSSSYV